MEEILEQIRQERKRQDELWSVQNHDLVEWISIIAEEFGEASKEAVDFHFMTPVKKNGQRIKATTLDQYDRLRNFRVELIQLAAVTVQAIESFDRQYN